VVADHQGGEYQVGIIKRSERHETSPPHVLASGSGAAGLPVVPHIAGAQTYPSRPVHISSEIPRRSRGERVRHPCTPDRSMVVGEAGATEWQRMVLGHGLSRRGSESILVRVSE
jgi:hypothetical protein